MSHNRDPREEAVQWLVRTNDPEFADWDEFSAWLEQDRQNGDAYHHLAASEARMAPLVRNLLPPNDRQPARRRGRRGPMWAGVAALAATVAAIFIPRAMPIDYATTPGEVRVIALGGSDELVMNGDTRIELAGLDRRKVILESGQILLRLTDPDRKGVRVQSGDLRLVDVGTIFEVTRERSETRVIVSQGSVIADPDGAALRLAVGQRLDTIDGAVQLKAIAADTNAVGAFEQGQLVYRNEKLATVLDDLRRTTGVDFSAHSGIGTLRFTGTLSTAEVKRDPRSLEPLLGVSMKRAGQGWRLQGRV